MIIPLGVILLIIVIYKGWKSTIKYGMTSNDIKREVDNEWERWNK